MEMDDWAGWKQGMLTLLTGLLHLGLTTRLALVSAVE